MAVVSKGMPHQLVCCHCLHVFDDPDHDSRAKGDTLTCPRCQQVNHVIDIEAKRRLIYFYLSDQPNP